MASHCNFFKLSGPRDHLIASGRQVLFGCGLPQDGGADKQIKRVGEGQRRLSRISLVAQLNAKRGSQKAGVPVSADRVDGRFTSEVSGTFQAVRRASRDVGHLAVPQVEDVLHVAARPDELVFVLWGSASQVHQHVEDTGCHSLVSGQTEEGIGAIGRGAHGFVSSHSVYGHFVPGGWK